MQSLWGPPRPPIPHRKCRAGKSVSRSSDRTPVWRMRTKWKTSSRPLTVWRKILAGRDLAASSTPRVLATRTAVGSLSLRLLILPPRTPPRSCLGAWQTQEGLLFFQAKVLSAYQSSAVPSVAHDDHLTTASKCPDPVQALTPAVTKTGGVSMKTSHKDRNNIGTLPAIMILRSPDVTSLPPGTVLGDNHSRSSLTISVLEEQQPCMS